MADFSAPSGPPPPKVPDGWVARWNDQYKEWFYVNTFTKKSQWDKPTAPAQPDDGSHLAPNAPPPSYSAGSNAPQASDSKANPFATDDHVKDAKTGGSFSNQEEEDERLARQLQEEEDARARSARPGSGQGAAASYASTPLPPGSSAGQGSFPDELPPRDGQGDKSRGLLGKLFGRNKTDNQYGGQPQYGGYGNPSPQPMYGGGYGGPPPQQGYGYGGPPPGAYGGGYGGPPSGGYYGGGYPPQQQQQPSRFGGGGGGIGAGGLALGAGAGLLGGVVIGDMLADHSQMEYQQGYQQGQNADDGGGGGGGDYGGGGGDYGGGGGGDFGGGGDGGGGGDF